MKKLRILTILIAMILMVSLCAGFGAQAAPTGTSFDAETIYVINKAFTSEIKTAEATFTLPSGYSGRGGVLLGNFASTSATCLSFEIHENGRPRIYTVDVNGMQRSHIFDQVNVATGKKVHLAISIDAAADKLYCYVDGTLKQTLSTSAATNTVSSTPFQIGGDPRSGNAQYFKGTIYSVAAFKNVRSASQIATDKNGISTSDSNLIAAYELSGKPSTIKDLGKGGFDAKLKTKWLTDKDPVTNYDYSFVMVGDTQIVAHNAPQQMGMIYDWIVDNVSKKKIKFVMGLGDIIDSWGNTSEWQVASAAIKKMNGKVPYSLVRGNHDDTAGFNNAFPYAEYKNKVGGTYDNTSIINSWQKFEVNGIKYMVFTLDFGANDSVLNWASELIAQNPTYNVIITTHAYLYRDGTTLDDREVCPPSKNGGTNDGDDIWNKLISKHENIVMVLSGHDPNDRVVLTQTKGKNGTIVSQFLIDPQGVDLSGATGMVAIFYFSNGGSRVTVEYYSTIKQQYFMEENQFSFDLAVIGDNGSTKPSNSTTKTTTSTTKSSSTTSATSTATTTSGTKTTSTATSTSQTVNQNGESTTSTTTQSSTTEQKQPSQGDSEGDNTTTNGAQTTTQANIDHTENEDSDNTMIWIFVGIGAFLVALIVVLVLVARKRK